MSFKNKVVLVTGASSGIGAATATLFAKEGADVILVARNETKLRKVEETCAKFGRKPLIITADVSNDGDVKRIVGIAIEIYKKLDVLVNNAGIIRFGSILNGKLLESFDEIMNTNLRSVVQLTTISAPHLVKTKGNIVNISSVAGSTVISDAGAYCTSKAALNQFTRAAALELAPHGIRVNIVSPGPVRTDILDNAGIDTSFEQMGVVTALNNRVSSAEEIAELVVFLASEKASGITGSNYVTDNGMMLIKS